ncbi:MULTISPECIES: PqqD family peptide modification chaperone [unclassified Bradyrhizobium]|uniref:PqqD family peptide modification chaperone n=1 Tax=unclassified Bradyrhizobium TaxID=2631580 RepID=UPI00143DA55C|nr:MULTISPECIES: PqqD family peptide modification chaperone [unclassified Bradyrhizobium]
MTATAPLLSNWWYRVAARKPRLRSHARLHRHRYRGEVWYLLQDPASTRVHRFSPSARLIIALMDGKRSIAELWEIANKHLGEDAPTQDEVIQLLGQLHSADLLESDVTPDVAELFARGEREERARFFRTYANPMALRLPLWDPDAALNSCQGLIRLIWSRWGGLLWLAMVLPALFLVPSHWPELSHNLSDRVLAVDNLLTLYLVFPLIKALHELGHASATKAGGGEVHDMGVVFLVLLPVPYVEASAATVFKSKYRRALVGAAGVIVELFVAAIAFYVWLLIEPGIVRALLFNVMLIAGVSTLLFNGNPLLRYDAYYILADLIEIPNLAARSTRYWGYLIERYLLGVHESEPPDATFGEKTWFVCYGFASTIYRMMVTIAIAIFIAGRFFVVGVILALWAVGAMAVFPVFKAVKHLVGSPRLHRHRRRAITVTAALLVAAAGFILFVPMPYHSHAEGVVWLPEQAVVRAGANGYFRDFLIGPGNAVTKGQALTQSTDPALDAQLRQSAAKVAELEAEYAANFVQDRNKAQIVSDRLDAERARLVRSRERSDALTARANTDGVFVVSQMGDMPGRYFHKGELLGYVMGNTAPIVRVVVPQDAVDNVRTVTNQIRLRLVHQPGVVMKGTLLREVPGGEEQLPSVALAAEGGGEIATDPRESKNPKALQRMFQFDVAIDDPGRVDRFGQRVYVRFEHQMTPLSVQWYRSIRRLFLSSLNV